MVHGKTIAEIRREYGQLTLNEDMLESCPFRQFEQWFTEVVGSEKNDPTAMVLSTVDKQGHPDSRIVLLKDIKDGTFVFYTNYESSKSKQITTNPYVALNFYWPEMVRQVRIRGQVKRISSQQSDQYFASRPKESQLSAIVSPQSKELKNRDELEKKFYEILAKYQNQEPIIRPKHWGGFAVTPNKIEFWQGRDNRLHDRIEYYKKEDGWHYHRLAP